MMVDVTSDSGRCGAPGVVSIVNIVVSTLMERSIQELVLFTSADPRQRLQRICIFSWYGLLEGNEMYKLRYRRDAQARCQHLRLGGIFSTPASMIDRTCCVTQLRSCTIITTSGRLSIMLTR